MKILILANSAEGLYKFRKELILELIKQSEVIVSIPNNSTYVPLLEQIGCKVEKLVIDRRGINPIKDIRLLKNYMTLIHKYTPDKIITYTIKCNIYGGIASQFKRINYYANITGLGTAFQGKGMIKKIIVNLYKLSLRKAKIVFFENTENKKIVIENKIIKENQAVILNGAGVNLEEYPFMRMPKNTDITFLFMGRIMKEKGIEELFEAAKKVKESYPHTSFVLLGNYEEAYKETVETLQKNNVIKYYGRVDDVRPFIENAHCIVLPSYHEGMSNTLLEGAAMGRALITSNISGCREAVIQNKNGYLCKVKDEKELYDRLVKFIHNSIDEIKEMGIVSRKHIEQNFNKKDIVEATVKHILS